MVCDHLSPDLFPGAFLGVNVFFVLSGFLITVVLLSSARSDGALPLGTFYVRRARRLLPAVSVLLVFATGYALITTSGQTLRAYVISLVGAFFYVVNWAAAFGHDVPAQLDHLWSLSVEEQFYLLWPIVLMFMVRHLPARRALLVSGGLALLSWALRAAIWSPSREGFAYESTLTRADGLLMGCMLGQIYARRLFDGALRALARYAAVGWAGLIGVLLLVPWVSEFGWGAFAYGIGVSGIASVLLIAHLVGDGSGVPGPVSRLFGARPVAALGRRAYSIYLWQNPVMFWLAGPLRDSVMRWPANLALTLLCAEISYRFVERPFLSSRRASGTANPVTSLPVPESRVMRSDPAPALEM